MSLPAAEGVDARGSHGGECSGLDEGFEEPDVDDVAHPVVAAGQRLGAGVQFLGDLVWDVEARHEAGRVDLERREVDPIGCDEVFVPAGSVVVYFV